MFILFEVVKDLFLSAFDYTTNTCNVNSLLKKATLIIVLATVIPSLLCNKPYWPAWQTEQARTNTLLNFVTCVLEASNHWSISIALCVSNISPATEPGI